MNPKIGGGWHGRVKKIYLSAAVFEEVDAEARRLERSRAWIIREAWKIARRTMLSGGA